MGETRGEQGVGLGAQIALTAIAGGVIVNGCPSGRQGQGAPHAEHEHRLFAGGDERFQVFVVVTVGGSYQVQRQRRISFQQGFQVPDTELVARGTGELGHCRGR